MSRKKSNFQEASDQVAQIIKRGAPFQRGFEIASRGPLSRTVSKLLREFEVCISLWFRGGDV